MTNFVSPLTPLGFCVLMLEGRLIRARRNEDGASAVEWVIIAAIVVGICIAVAGILRNALVGKAGDVSRDVGNQ
jgi:Flp pilus assembly pilin Flp